LSTNIVNYTRSKEYAFSFQIHVDMATPSELVQTFRLRIIDYQKQFPQVKSDDLFLLT